MTSTSLNIISYNVRGLKNEKKGEPFIVFYRKKGGTLYFYKKLTATLIKKKINGVRNGKGRSCGVWVPHTVKV